MTSRVIPNNHKSRFIIGSTFLFPPLTKTLISLATPLKLTFLIQEGFILIFIILLTQFQNQNARLRRDGLG